MADYNSKYSGEQVEALLDQVASGNAGGGGGGGITVETDPIFSASPAASITEEKITEWNSKSAQGEKGDKGDTGVGVQSVAQTTTSNADGGSNVWSMVLTDGTRSSFVVKNGSKGSQGTQGIQGAQGPKGAKGDDGVNGATFTPSVDSAGNLSWSNNKGLANPPTVNIKGPKGDKGDAGEGGGGSSGGGGVEIISLSGGFGIPLIIEEMLAEKRYYLYVNGDFDGNAQSIVVEGFEGHEAVGEATIKHFYAVIECISSNGNPFDVSLSLPDGNIRWANGVLPSIVGGANRLYELSITQVNDYGIVYYNAVLTPFNYVE